MLSNPVLAAAWGSPLNRLFARRLFANKNSGSLLDVVALRSWDCWRQHLLQTLYTPHRVCVRKLIAPASGTTKLMSAVLLQVLHNSSYTAAAEALSGAMQKYVLQRHPSNEQQMR